MFLCLRKQQGTSSSQTRAHDESHSFGEENAQRKVLYLQRPTEYIYVIYLCVELAPKQSLIPILLRQRLKGINQENDIRCKIKARALI